MRICSAEGSGGPSGDRSKSTRPRRSGSLSFHIPSGSRTRPPAGDPGESACFSAFVPWFNLEEILDNRVNRPTEISEFCRQGKCSMGKEKHNSKDFSRVNRDNKRAFRVTSYNIGVEYNSLFSSPGLDFCLFFG